MFFRTLSPCTSTKFWFEWKTSPLFGGCQCLCLLTHRRYNTLNSHLESWWTRALWIPQSSVLMGCLNSMKGVARNGRYPYGTCLLLFRQMLDCPSGLHLPYTTWKIKFWRILRWWQKSIKWSSGASATAQAVTHEAGHGKVHHTLSVAVIPILVVLSAWSCAQKIVDHMFLQDSGSVLPL